jgi:hypothetical protein
MGGDYHMDSEYKKMMTWVAVALVASVIAALVIVEVVMRKYGS